MSLIEYELGGVVRDKVAMAIERIKKFEKQALSLNPLGYHVAFSGGKDSQVVEHLVRRAEVKHHIQFNVTTVDPPELLRFIKREYPHVVWSYPKKNMWQLIIQHRTPPTRIIRYCCDHLKERAGDDSMIITGIRWQESNRRKRHRMVSSCNRNKTKMYLHPIIDWSSAEVWEYIRFEGLPHCSLYDDGWDRIGCILCPMARRGQRIIDMERWPRFVELYSRAFEKMLIRRKETEMQTMKQWESVNDVWAWWLQEHTKTMDGKIDDLITADM